MSRRRRPPALAAARRLAGPAALALAAARRVAGPATLAAVALAAGCQRVGGPHVNLQRMFVQPRYEPYGPSRFFADGKAMQLPPAGTVAREAVPAPTTAPPADSATLALGLEQYRIACALCHGGAGEGRGLVAANLPRVPGLVLRTPAVQALAPAALYAFLEARADIRHVRAREFSPRERWAVVTYLRTLLASEPPPAAADSAASALPSLHADGVQQ